MPLKSLNLQGCANLGPAALPRGILLEKAQSTPALRRISAADLAPLPAAADPARLSGCETRLSSLKACQGCSDRAESQPLPLARSASHRARGMALPGWRCSAAAAFKARTAIQGLPFSELGVCALRATCATVSALATMPLRISSTSAAARRSPAERHPWHGRESMLLLAAAALPPALRQDLEPLRGLALTS